MEYSPQQEPPMRSQSEVYLPKQAQVYAPQIPVYAQQYPGQEIMQTSMNDQAIVIYPDRTHAIVNTISYGIMLAFGIMVFTGAIALFLILSTTLQSKFLVPLVIYLALWLPALAFGSWGTWNMAQFAFKRTPLLIIDRQGITVGQAPMNSGFFIPWHEIEAIHAHTFMHKYFCIRPKDTKQFLKYFNIFERFNRRSNIIIGAPPLIVSQNFLESPIEEVLQQLQVFYAHELDTYHIRLRP
jgi:hypothetical protein